MKLVLIEDNPLLAELYKNAFEEKGVEVFPAHEGRSGLQLVSKKKPEVILLDLLMVGINGFEVLKTLKSDKKAQHRKVVILTLVDDAASKTKAKKLGADGYLVKSELKTKDIVKNVMAYFDN